MKKLISILLCLVMLIGIMPMEVFAVDYIYAVDLLIDAPMTGQTASFSATAYGPSYQINNITRTDYYNGVLWHDLTTEEHLAPGDTFVEGHIYKVAIRVVPSDVNNYSFHTDSMSYLDLNCTVNGNAVDENDVYGGSKEIAVEYTFPPCGGGSGGGTTGYYQITYNFLYDDIVEIHYTDEFGVIPQLDPQRDGYYFYRWYTDVNFRNLAPVAATSDMTLYARWVDPDDICYITLYLSTDAEEPTAGFDIVKGESLDCDVEPPYQDGMYFAGWYTDRECTNRFYYYEAVEEDISIFPRFVPYEDLCEVQIYESVDSPEPAYGVEVPYGDCYTPPYPQFIPRGYTFVGWYRDRQLSRKYYDDEPIIDTVYLFPKFVSESDICHIWIYGSADYPEPYDEVIVEKGEYYDPYWPEYEPEGMYFAGFYTDRSFQNEYDPDVPVTGNVSIFPKFVDRSQVCFINLYHLENQTEPTISTYVLKGECYKPATPGQEGKIFAGWYTDRALTVPYDETAPLYVDSIEIFAKYVPEMLLTPKLVSASNVNGGVKITWEAVPYAENYRVYVKNGSGWQKLGDTTDTSYIHYYTVSGTTYTYTVKCVSADGKKSRSSYNKTGISVTYIEAPAVSSITSAYGGVQLKWSACGGAAKYRIYRKNGKSWVAIATATGLTYTDANVTDGTKYTYTLRAYSSDGKVYSSYNGTGWPITFVASPKITSIQNVATGAKLTWGGLSSAAKYRVYVKNNGKWVKLADTASTSYIHTAAKGGTTYIYTVRSINSSGKLIGSYNATGWKNLFIAVPALPTLTNTSSGVKIAFKKSAGAVKYRIFRKTTGGKWAKLVDTTSLSYVDKSAKNGTKYYYTIRCISSDGKKYTSYYNTTGKAITCKR